MLQMNLSTFNNDDNYEETITNTKAISGESRRRVRGFFVCIADGAVAGSPFEHGVVGASVGVEAAALYAEGQACDHGLLNGGS